MPMIDGRARRRPLYELKGGFSRWDGTVTASRLRTVRYSQMGLCVIVSPLDKLLVIIPPVPNGGGGDNEINRQCR